MKSNRENKKLQLHKTVIATLKDSEKNAVKGGLITLADCPTSPYLCTRSIPDCTITY